MLCPNCRTEYREGLYECADCGATLVPELPAKPEKQPGPYDLPANLVTVLSTLSLPHLAVAKSVLDGAGIKYFIKNETYEAYPVTGFAEIQVADQDAEYAIQLLSSLVDHDVGDDIAER